MNRITLIASPSPHTGISAQGGGLYVTNPLTTSNTTVAGNSPDNAGSSC